MALSELSAKAALLLNNQLLFSLPYILSIIIVTMFGGGKQIPIRGKRDKLASMDEKISPAITRNASKNTAIDAVVATDPAASCEFEELDQRYCNKFENLFRQFEQKFNDLFNEAVDGLKARISKLESQVEKAEKQCLILADECDDLNRRARLSHVVIRGVPKSDNEDVKAIVQTIAGKANYTLSHHFDAFRVNSTSNRVSMPHSNNKLPTPNSLVIVKLSSPTEASSFITAYKKSGGVKLKDFPGFSSNSAIYLNESLTAKNNAILREALSLKRSGKIVKAFTRNGLVYIKRSENENPIKLRNCASLLEVTNNNSGARATSK